MGIARTVGIRIMRRDEVNRRFPFDADNMTQDDYDDLAVAMNQNDTDEVERITQETWE